MPGKDLYRIPAEQDDLLRRRSRHPNEFKELTAYSRHAGQALVGVAGDGPGLLLVRVGPPRASPRGATSTGRGRHGLFRQALSGPGVRRATPFLPVLG